MKYIVRKITSSYGEIFYDAKREIEGTEHYIVDADNRKNAIEQVRGSKNYLEDFDHDNITQVELLNRTMLKVPTANLDETLLLVLYQRLNEYLDVGGKVSDLEYKMFIDANGNDVTEKELLETILHQIQSVYKMKFIDFENEDIIQRETFKLFNNLSKIFHHLWW